MQIFYATGVSDDICVLDATESLHCIRVLRMKKGSIVNLVDGKGNLYEGFISDPDPRCCKITITATTKEFEKRDYRLHIAISPLKNHDRFEWFIEKSVEIGIDEITPIICTNTEKPGVKSDRINSIITSAMKQSIKAFRPVLNDPVTFREFQDPGISWTRMIAHCNLGGERSRIDQVCTKGKDALILIGPEGDFTEEEVSQAIKKGYRPVHLGKSRLRTETAGICACHSIYFINQ